MHRVLTIAIALCWPVYGLLAMMLFQRIAGRQPSPWFMVSVAASWLVVGFVWGKWVNRNKCPQCGKAPFGRNSFWARRLRCKNCGFAEAI